MRPILAALLFVAMPAMAQATALCAVGTPQEVPDHAQQELPPGPISASRIASVPALIRIASAGARLTSLGETHGMRGVFAQNHDHFQVFYLTPDGKAVVGGVMWDASGHNITRQQASQIEGAVPTVTIDAAAIDPITVATLDRSVHGDVGRPGAPHLWMIVDPLCSFSVRAMEALKPYVAAGKVRLSIVPVSILDYEDHGQSTRAAQALLSLPADQIADAWMGRHMDNAASDTAAVALQTNMAVIAGRNLRGTPTFVWWDRQGRAGTSAGIPDDLDALLGRLPT